MFYHVLLKVSFCDSVMFYEVLQKVAETWSRELWMCSAALYSQVLDPGTALSHRSALSAVPD